MISARALAQVLSRIATLESRNNITPTAEQSEPISIEGLVIYADGSSGEPITGTPTPPAYDGDEIDPANGVARKYGAGATFSLRGGEVTTVAHAYNSMVKADVIPQWVLDDAPDHSGYFWPNQLRWLTYADGKPAVNGK